MPEKEMIPEKAAVVVDYGYHTKRWEQSGMKQVDYCQAEGLNYPRFVMSRSKLLEKKRQAKKQGASFIPVIPAAGASINSKSDVILLRLPKGSVIEIPSSLAPTQLSIVLKSLGRQLC